MTRFGVIFALLSAFLSAVSSQVTTCPGVICPKDCAYGAKVELNLQGCKVCQCQRRPRCPRPSCLRTTNCLNGYKRVDGCIPDTCECNVGACPPLTCKPAQNCTGFAKDFRGVGCPTCDCLSAERSSAVACLDLACFRSTYCASGMRQQRAGCDICLCEVMPVCPVVTCTNTCFYGFKYVNGCKTCQCKSAPPADCPTIACTRADCFNGYEIDTRGCPMCTCKATPHAVNQTSRRRRRARSQRSGTPSGQGASPGSAV